MTSQTAIAVLLAALAVAISAGSLGASDRPETTPDDHPVMTMSVMLLEEALVSHRDGRHVSMLQALRHLREPRLAPLMEHLARSTDPNLRIHGILGLGELSADRQIDLDRVLATPQTAWQAEILGAAIQHKLLGEAQASVLMASSRVDDSIKVLVGGYLARDRLLTDQAAIRRAAAGDHLPRAAIAAVILIQQGDPDASELMEGIVGQVSGRARDALLQLALRTAYQFDFDRVGDWSLQIAANPQLGLPVRLAALELAMRRPGPGVQQVWEELYAQAGDLANQTRLALIALRTSTSARPELFDTLTESSDAMIRKIGQAGRAVASGRDIEPALTELIRTDHTIARLWVLGYAAEQAKPDQAVRLLGRFIEQARPSDAAVAADPGRSTRLDQAVTAVGLMFDRDPDQAVSALKQLLANKSEDPQLLEAVLGGLLRSGHPRSVEPLDGLSRWDRAGIDELAALLRSRWHDQLSEADLESLEHLVLGSQISQRALRIQGACLWLKHQQRLDETLDQILASRPSSIDRSQTRARNAVQQVGP